MNRPRWIVIMATAIPPTLFTIVSVVLALLNPELLGTEGLNIVDICGQVSFGLLAIAFISSIVFAIRRKQEIAKGIFFGFGIGLVLWVIAFIVLSGLSEGWA
jgi:Na+-transporting NADH:ubiquinone oxidoreductase subunit NqrE